MLSQAVEELCKCGKCEATLTEKRSIDVVTKQFHITLMVMSEVYPGFLLRLNWKSFRQMIHGFQMLATVTKSFMADVTIFEFQPL